MMKFPLFRFPGLQFVLLGWLLLAGNAMAAEAQAWLLLSPTRDDGVMTLNAEEKNVLVNAGWSVDGTGLVQTEPAPGSALLHRMLRKRPEGIDRMLESDETKLAERLKAGFVEEGLLGYVAAKEGPERIPVVQFTKGEQRLWLVDAQSQKTAEEKGWKKQGVQFWLWPIGGAKAAE